MRDQVPELMYAHESPGAGTAATAAAVSWVAGAMTGTPATPVCEATEGRSGPSTVPGWTSVPRMRSGRPKRRTRSIAQPRADGSMSWLVLASVYSFALMPVSQ